MIFALIILGSAGNINAQHEFEGRYIQETDPLVIEKLEIWQDIKFGLMMHWAPYSQWGIVESWSLCSYSCPPATKSPLQGCVDIKGFSCPAVIYGVTSCFASSI
ncbi:MAG: alpha-L-fucosidase [Bacteroidales bacterium]